MVVVSPPVGAERMITVLGRDLRVVVRQGSGAGRRVPPLLLCSGLGASLDVMEPFVDALDPSIEVVRFDVPGVGGSPRAPFPYPFPLLAGLARRLLRHLGHDRADVLGFSWGGALAQQMAVQYPGAVRRLVLVGTSTGLLMVPGRPGVLARMLTMRRFTDRAYAASVVGSLYGGSARRRPDQVLRLLGDGIGGPALDGLSGNGGSGGSVGYGGYSDQLVAALAWTSLPWLRLIRQPTLIVAGADDPIVPLVNARILRWLIPRSRLHVHDGGHLALITEAPDLAPVVARFLRAGGAAVG